MLVSVVSMKAQDTIYHPLDNYYQIEPWPGDTLPYLALSYTSGGIWNRRVGIATHTDTVLQIYGIGGFFYGAYHSSGQTCLRCDLQLLAKNKNGGWDRLESSILDWNETPIAHYVQLDRIDPQYESWPPQPDAGHFYRAYELYFDTIVDVRDSFAVVQQVATSLDCIGLGFMALIPNHPSTEALIPPSTYLRENAENVWGYGRRQSYFTIFPLLSPDYHPPVQPNDTTGQTGIHTLADGVTTVQPNPARERVRAVSSAGLLRVEVYDMVGHRVYGVDATGNSHYVDVNGWPAGTYIMKLHTPIGVATKQLVVQ